MALLHGPHGKVRKGAEARQMIVSKLSAHMRKLGRFQKWLRTSEEITMSCVGLQQQPLNQAKSPQMGENPLLRHGKGGLHQPFHTRLWQLQDKRQS